VVGRPDEGWLLASFEPHRDRTTRQAAASLEGQPQRRQGIRETTHQAPRRYEHRSICNRCSHQGIIRRVSLGNFGASILFVSAFVLLDGVLNTRFSRDEPYEGNFRVLFAIMRFRGRWETRIAPVMAAVGISLMLGDYLT
jgi:hypothetical protein